jgi:hypothetical protein
MDNTVTDLKEKRWDVDQKKQRNLMNMVLKLRVSYKAGDFQGRAVFHGIK